MRGRRMNWRKLIHIFITPKQISLTVVSQSLVYDWPLTSSYAQSWVFQLSGLGNEPSSKGQKLL